MLQPPNRGRISVGDHAAGSIRFGWFLGEFALAHGHAGKRGARLGGDILHDSRHSFDEDRAPFIFLSIARNSTAKLPTFAAVEEPLVSANGDDLLAFWALHLHPRSMHSETM